MTYRVVYTDSPPTDFEIERRIFNDVDAEIINAEQHSEDVHELITDADALIISHYELDAETVQDLERCRVVSRLGIGVDYIDIEACTDHGIVVTNLPEYCLEEVATHTISMMMALNRLVPYDQHVRDGDWKARVNDIPRIESQTLGLVGFGNIAQTVCERVDSLGIDIVAHDPYLSDDEIRESGATPKSSLDSLLSTSDYVSLHTPLTPETKHLLSIEEFEEMKQEAYIINTSRGGLVHEGDLIDALQDGLIGGAGLDVLNPEPPREDNPLLKRDDVILTPHIGHLSDQSRINQREQAAKNARDVLLGATPQHVVNEAVLDSISAD